MLLLDLKINRSCFSFKNLLLIGIVPFILLILSQSFISGFIISRLFSGSEKIQELVFYLLSRDVLWSVWSGFALGTSIRPVFGKVMHKHAVTYILRDDDIIGTEE
jgi:hypothetical protein